MTLCQFKVGLGAAAVSLAIAVPSAFAVSSLIYVTNSAGDNVHVIDSATNKVVQVIKGIEASHGVAFSPDGKWLTYTSDESGNPEIFVRPFPALDRKWKISQGGALHPHWRRDGDAGEFIWDDSKYETLITSGKQVYILEERV